MLPLMYSLRNLHMRRGRTFMTVVGIGLVVAVFCYLLCFAGGLRRALARSGDPLNVLVIAEAATAESNSALPYAQANTLRGVPQAGRDARGAPLVSSEYVTQSYVERRADPEGPPALVIVRGVDLDLARAVHPAIELVAGRWCAPGQDELVVGRSAAEQFREGDLGAMLACGDRSFTIVGVFRAGGAARESEFWGPGPNVAAAYRREMYSSATLRLADASPETRAAAIARVQSASVALRAIPEPEYFASQTQNARILEGLALALVVLMGAGAVFAAMNTMHAAVTARTREIGMLRALGFSPRRILGGILAESLALAVVGGTLGCLGCLALILLDRGSKDLVGFATFASVAFRVTFTWESAVAALGVAVLIGGLGGLWPARTAARLPIVDALRTV